MGAVLCVIFVSSSAHAYIFLWMGFPRAYTEGVHNSYEEAKTACEAGAAAMGVECTHGGWSPQAYSDTYCGPQSNSQYLKYTSVDGLSSYFHLGCMEPSYACPNGVFPNNDGSCPACRDDSHCANSLSCDGEETCVDNECVAGMSVVCESTDALTCNSTCEEGTGCVSEACTCSGEQPVDLEISFSRKVEGLDVACPLAGGVFAASVSVSDKLNVKVPTCHNECLSQTTGEMNMEFIARMCTKSGETPISLVAKGTMSRKEEGCPATCEDGNCELQCPSGGCVTTSYSAKVSPSVSKFVGLGHARPTRLFGSLWSVSCGAELKANVGLEVGVSEVENQDSCATCEQCTTIDFTSELGGSAAATCRVKGGFFGHKFDLALENFGTIEANITGLNRGTTGACGDSYCGTTKATVKGGFDIPIAASQARWWGVPLKQSIKCRAYWSGCREQNTCGGPDTCDEMKSEFTCGLTVGL